MIHHVYKSWPARPLSLRQCCKGSNTRRGLFAAGGKTHSRLSLSCRTSNMGVCRGTGVAWAPARRRLPLARGTTGRTRELRCPSSAAAPGRPQHGELPPAAGAAERAPPAPEPSRQRCTAGRRADGAGAVKVVLAVHMSVRAPMQRLRQSNMPDAGTCCRPAQAPPFPAHLSASTRPCTIAAKVSRHSRSWVAMLSSCSACRCGKSCRACSIWLSTTMLQPNTGRGV